MPILSDIAHVYGGDLGTAPSGDLATVSYGTRTTQRVIRRLLTAATSALMSDYPWEPPYGAGLGARVGVAGVSVAEVQAVILSQLLMEESVAPFPLPTVTVFQPIIGTFEVDATYTDQSGSLQDFQFSVDNSGASA